VVHWRRQIRAVADAGCSSARRHNRAVRESWDDLIDHVGRRPGMFVGRDRYALVRSFVEGFGAAKDDDVLPAFQDWLSGQPQHRAIRNYAWSSLLLHELFPERDQMTRLPWQDDPATADSGCPVPAPSPVSEDDLAYPEDDAKAITHLFARLRQHLLPASLRRPQVAAKGRGSPPLRHRHDHRSRRRTP
jgi:hypothetical protein